MLRVMNKWCFLLLLFVCKVCFAQNKQTEFAAIDWRVQFVDAPNADSLAKQLTAPYNRDVEKVRAIYSWITSHIAYNMGVFSRGNGSVKFADVVDTSLVWKSADEMVADRVLSRRVAVCDGYSRLFKTLCEYSGIRSELVLGYVRSGAGQNRFKTNHTWNAVMIDSAWHLVDVTWGSGFVTYANEFVQKSDDYYFLTPPESMIRDHYPEDPQWTLMTNPPLLSEFKNMPFRCKAFIKYDIKELSPLSGVLHASVGDTLKFEVYLDTKKAKRIASSNYNDSLQVHFRYPIVEPSGTDGNKVLYTFLVSDPNLFGLQLSYNKDVILQYRINVKDKADDVVSLIWNR